MECIFTILIECLFDEFLRTDGVYICNFNRVFVIWVLEDM